MDGGLVFFHNSVWTILSVCKDMKIIFILLLTFLDTMLLGAGIGICLIIYALNSSTNLKELK